MYGQFESLGVQVAGVMGQDAAGVAAWLKTNPLPFPLLIDTDRDVIKQYGVWHMIGMDAFNMARPSAFIVNREMVIRFIYVSRNQWDRPDPEELVRQAANVK